MSVREDVVNLQVNINGERAGKTLAEIQREARELRTELRKLPVDSDEFRKKAEQLRSVNERIRSINNDLRGTKSAWDDVKKSLTGFSIAAAAAIATRAIIDFGKQSIKAYDEAAQGEAQLLNALEGRVDVQERLLKQAKEIQKTTLFQDDQIVAAQTFLAAQKLTEEQIKKTILAAVQLSTVTGEDLQTTTEKLSATYEGSIGKLGRLDDRFKTLSKDQLANGAAIDLVNEKYKGFAETAAKTGLGPWKQMLNEINDLQEIIGKTLLPAILGIVDAFRSFLKTVGEFTTAIGRLAGNTDTATIALDWFRKTVEVLLSPITIFMKTTTWLANKMADLAGNTKEAGKEMEKLTGGNTSHWTDGIEKAAGTLGELQEKLKSLKDDLQNAEIGSDRFVELQKEIKDTEKLIDNAIGKEVPEKLKKTSGQIVEIVTGTAHEISESSKEHYGEVEKQAKEYFSVQEKLEDAAFQSTLDSHEREQVAIMQKYDALREMADQFGLDTTGIQKAMEAELLALQKDFDAEQVKEDAATKKKLSKTDEQYWNGRIELINTYGNVVIQALNTLGAASGKDLEFQKAAALAQIAIDTGVAIAGAVAQNATHSLSPIDFAVKLGAQIAAILGAIGTAVGYFKNTEIPKYAKGRRTDGPEVAMIGEEGTEYVIPTNPRYRPQAIELLSSAMRDIAPVRGFNPSMPAGFRTGLTGGSSFAVNYPGEQMMMKTMYELKKEMAMLRDLLEEGVEARLDYDKFTRSLERISASKRRAGVIG